MALIFTSYKNKSDSKGPGSRCPFCWLTRRQRDAARWPMGAALDRYRCYSNSRGGGLVAQCRGIAVCEWVCPRIARHIMELWLFQPWLLKWGTRKGWWLSQDTGDLNWPLRRVGLGSPLGSVLGRFECLPGIWNLRSEIFVTLCDLGQITSSFRVSSINETVFVCAQDLVKP